MAKGFFTKKMSSSEAREKLHSFIMSLDDSELDKILAEFQHIYPAILEREELEETRRKS